MQIHYCQMSAPKKMYHYHTDVTNDKKHVFYFLKHLEKVYFDMYLV